MLLIAFGGREDWMCPLSNGCRVQCALKVPLPVGGSALPHLIHGSMAHATLHASAPNGILIGSGGLAELTFVINRQTDHASEVTTS